MSDGDFGGGGFDSGGFDGGFHAGSGPEFSPPDSSMDYSPDYGPPLEGPGGTVDPPQQMLYVDGSPGPQQAPDGEGRHTTGFVASGGAFDGTPSSYSASGFLVPAMMMGTMANPQPGVGGMGMNPAARRQPIGCAAIFFMFLFVAVALGMAGVAFRSGFGVLGLIPIGMALFAIIAIATGAGQSSRRSRMVPPTQPFNQAQWPHSAPVQRFCTYCGRLAQGMEPGCVGCGGPIEGKPRTR